MMPATNMNHGLSKSKVAAFEQCPKRLWLAVHRPEEARYSDETELRFAAGHLVGAAACELLPDGIMVEAVPDLAAAVVCTQELLAEGIATVIFEATFAFKNVLVRVDVLEADGSGGWHIAEVKSTTSAKDPHHGDLATQVWVVASSGLAVSGASIRHLNRDFILEREGDYRGVFVDVEIMNVIAEVIAGRGDVTAAAHAVLDGSEPARDVGSHCQDPYPCQFLHYCEAKMPPGPEWPVTILPSGGGKKWLAKGITDLLAVDPDALTNATHSKVHRATITGEPFHDPDGAAVVIDGWPFPRSWLDFETISFALPRWVGTRPFEQVPFQFSVHIEGQDGTCEHREFLSLDGTDPRRPCAEGLLALVPSEGAVVAYNAPFERGCIQRLAERFSDLAEPLLAIARRIVDLLPVTRANWYHRDQRGSWSIKAVLPTVASIDYSELQVQGGSGAQAAYLEAINADTTVDRLDELDQALRAYCSRDTEAMMMLARRLIAR